MAFVAGLENEVVDFRLGLATTQGYGIAAELVIVFIEITRARVNHAGCDIAGDNRAPVANSTVLPRTDPDRCVN